MTQVLTIQMAGGHHRAWMHLERCRDLVHSVVYLCSGVCSAGWSWEHNFHLQLMLPILVGLFCFIKFLGSTLVWRLKRPDHPTVLYRLLALLFTVPDSDQALKASAFTCGRYCDVVQLQRYRCTRSFQPLHFAYL